MKKRILSLTLAILIVSVFTFSFAGSFNVKTQSNVTKVYGTPNGVVKGSLAKHTFVAVHKIWKDGAHVVWYKIKYGSQFGWIKEADTVTKTYHRVIITKNVNVRKCTWGAIVGYLPEGKVVKVYGMTRDANGKVWWKIKFKGQYRYIHSALTSKYTIKPPVVKISQMYVAKKAVFVRKKPYQDKLGVLRKGKLIEVTGFDGMWAKVIYKGKKAYVYKTYLTRDLSFVSPYKVAVTAKALNVRKAPWKKVIGSLKKHQIVTVYGYKKDTLNQIWLKIKYNGRYGYISQKFTTSDKMLITKILEKGYKKVRVINKGGLNVRKAPARDIIGYLPKNAVVKFEKFYSNTSNWLEIKYHGKKAYIYAGPGYVVPVLD